MNKENVLYLMMGIPGSGKSTYAKQFASRNKIQYISRDEIRFSLLQPTDEYFDKENEVMKILREKTNLALENGSTLVDSTNLSEKSRARLLNYIKTECAAIVVLFMDTTVSTALKRNALRKKREKVPDEELIRMYSRIEIPCNNGEDINYLVTIAENNEIKITKIKEAVADDLFIKRLAF